VDTSASIFDNEIIVDPGLVFVTIKNSGNVPIRKEDFQDPLVVRVTGSPILSAEVKRTSPLDLAQSLQLSLSEQSQEVAYLTILPLLLNGGDSMTIKLIVSNCAEGNAELHGRISGIPDFNKLHDRPFKPGFIVHLVLAILGASTFEFLLGNHTRQWFSLPLLVVLLSGYYLSLRYVDSLVDYILGRIAKKHVATAMKQN
jgi:hypothetical protein